MLTRNVTAIREIPGEPGEKLTIRQLGWRQLNEAEEARSAASLRNVRAMGPELFQSLQGIDRGKVEGEAAQTTAADPLAKYDQATILRYGIVAWTYSEKVTPDTIDTLDPATARWAALEILDMGKPPLEQEAERDFFASPHGSTEMATTALKNGSSL